MSLQPEPPPRQSLEVRPEGPQGRAERRWAWIGLATLVAVAGVTAFTLRELGRLRPALPAGPGDHGPLPDAVRAEVLTLVEPHLREAKLVELNERGLREFRITGTPTALLSQDFHRAFRPLVVEHLRPLLAPYGEVLSFDITALDLPPTRLRDFEAAPSGARPPHP